MATKPTMNHSRRILANLTYSGTSRSPTVLLYPPRIPCRIHERQLVASRGALLHNEACTGISSFNDQSGTVRMVDEPSSWRASVLGVQVGTLVSWSTYWRSPTPRPSATRSTERATRRRLRNPCGRRWFHTERDSQPCGGAQCCTHPTRRRARVAAQQRLRDLAAASAILTEPQAHSPVVGSTSFGRRARESDEKTRRMAAKRMR